VLEGRHWSWEYDIHLIFYFTQDCTAREKEEEKILDRVDGVAIG
jgi:hypothetical protein